jgi:hypothetical protein
MEAVVGKSLWEDPWFFAAVAPNDGQVQCELCPVTGYACEGDLSHLCEEYGCARKGGLSPRSEENF